ncbi:MAG: hypothetical protein IJC32_00935 [Clostridia bacterium]|nr:hypothetical protein [Clostridia bacterium]
MATYSYADFEKLAREAGLYETFSDADLQLAKKNPDAGISLLTQKKNWRSATTDSARALANAEANRIRQEYGEYSGGIDGSGYTITSPSPSSFSFGNAPTYSGQYDDTMNNLLQSMINYGDYSYGGEKPVWDNKYGDIVDSKFNDIMNRPDFSYDHEKDPLFSQYKKAYTREGDRATANTMAQAAAQTGGQVSSYAAGAAAQAGNYYAAQLADKIPELQQIAHNQYLNDAQLAMSDLSAAQSMQQNEYNRYLSELSQYNTDRSFDYGTWIDKYNMLNTNLGAALSLDQNAYNKFLTQLNQYNTDREFEYGKYIDEIDTQSADKQNALNMAITAAQYGDYSQLKALGIDTSGIESMTNYEKQLELAKLAAQYGNTSLLEKITGVKFGQPTGGGNTTGTSGLSYDDLLDLYKATKDPNVLNKIMGMAGIQDSKAIMSQVETSLVNMSKNGTPKSEISKALTEAYTTGAIDYNTYWNLKLKYNLT